MRLAQQAFCDAIVRLPVKFPFPILVCDVGGTNARFAIKHAPESGLAQLQPRETHAFPSLGDATRSVLDEHTETPRCASSVRIFSAI